MGRGETVSVGMGVADEGTSVTDARTATVGVLVVVGIGISVACGRLQASAAKVSKSKAEIIRPMGLFTQHLQSITGDIVTIV